MINTPTVTILFLICLSSNTKMDKSSPSTITGSRPYILSLEILFLSVFLANLLLPCP